MIIISGNYDNYYDDDSGNEAAVLLGCTDLDVASRLACLRFLLAVCLWCILYCLRRLLKHLDISFNERQSIKQSNNQSTNWLIDWLVSEFCHHQESQERFSDNPGPGLLWGVLPLPACHWLCLEKVGPNMITTMPIVVWWRYQWWKPWWEVPSNSSLLCLSPQILIHYDVLQIGIRFSPPTLRWRFKRALLILRYVWKHQDRIFIKWSTLHKVDVLLGSNTQEGLLFTQVIFQQLTIR